MIERLSGFIVVPVSNSTASVETVLHHVPEQTSLSAGDRHARVTYTVLSLTPRPPRVRAPLCAPADAQLQGLGPGGPAQGNTEPVVLGCGSHHLAPHTGGGEMAYKCSEKAKVRLGPLARGETPGGGVGVGMGGQ